MENNQEQDVEQVQQQDDKQVQKTKGEYIKDYIVANLGQVVLLIALMMVWIYAWNLGTLDVSTKDSAPWGAFGDFFGGILNPLIAGCALYVLIQSFNVQKKELKETTKAMQKQVEQLDRQNFETFFMQLISYKKREWEIYIEQNNNTLKRRMELWAAAHLGLDFSSENKDFKNPFSTIDFIKQVDGFILTFIQMHQYIKTYEQKNRVDYERIFIGFLDSEQIHVIVFYYLISRQIQGYDKGGDKYGSYTNLLNNDAVDELKPIIEYYELMRFCDKSHFGTGATIQALRVFLDKKAWGDKWEFWRVNLFAEDEESDDKTE